MLAPMRTSMPSTVRPASSACAHPPADRLGVGRVGQDDRELVAAEAGEHVAGAQHRAQTRADLLEHEVAGAVAERVVELLEAVEVDEQQRDRRAAERGRPRGARRSDRSRWRRFGRPVRSSVVRLAADLGEAADVRDRQRRAGHRRERRPRGEHDGRRGRTLQAGVDEHAERRERERERRGEHGERSAPPGAGPPAGCHADSAISSRPAAHRTSMRRPLHVRAARRAGRGRANRPRRRPRGRRRASPTRGRRASRGARGRATVERGTPEVADDIGDC